MNKERLEEIKQRLVLLHNAAGVDDETKRYIFEYLKVEWLIERVQELEDIIYQDERQAVLEGMYEQNKRYQEALEFINEELELVLHSNKGLAEKMFYIENSKRKITEVLEGESNE